MEQLKEIINISSPLNFKPNHLFELGKRENNQKREFLFINKLIGKHLETSPTVVKATGHLLAGLKFNDLNNSNNLNSLNNSNDSNNLNNLSKIDAKDIYILAEYIKNQSRKNKRDEKYFESKAKYITKNHKYNYSYNFDNFDNLKKLKNLESLESLENTNKVDKRNNKRVLVIGFAETATALGMSVAASIKNSDYQSTTRDVFSNLTYIDKTNKVRNVSVNKRFSFEEEHSHATTHILYNAQLNKNGELVSNKQIDYSKYAEIILVDDELSTGRTICNIIKKLTKETNIKRYSVLSILDFRNKYYQSLSNNLEKEKNIEIKYYSLMKGELVLLDNDLTSKSKQQNQINEQLNKENKEKSKNIENKENNKNLVYKNINILDLSKMSNDLDNNKGNKNMFFNTPLLIERTDDNLVKVQTENKNTLYLKSGRFMLSSKQISDIDQEIENYFSSHNLLEEIEVMIKNINYRKFYNIKNTIIPQLKESTVLFPHSIDKIIYNLENLINSSNYYESYENQKDIKNKKNHNNNLHDSQENQKKILVLSEGEDMYIPSRIASYLEDNGYDVKFKTTSRSPIAIDSKIIKDREYYDVIKDEFNNITSLENIKNIEKNNKINDTIRFYFYNKQYSAQNFDLVLFIFEKTNILLFNQNNLKALYFK